MKGEEMKIRLIAMDVDGTLYNSQKQITPDTRKALLQAQEQGAVLILASGRPTSGLQYIAKELEMDRHHGLLVSYNGSKVTDCQDGTVLFDQAMSVEDGKAVLEHLKKFDQVIPMVDCGPYMYVNDVFQTIRLDGKDFQVVQYESRGGRFQLCEQRDLAAFVDFPLNKILTAASPEYLQGHYQEMAAPFQDRLNAMFTGRFYFEFTAKDIDKAKALDAALKSLGYSREEMIAFGDGQNDASMLEFAGMGVAMENAVPQLKEIADEITASCDEDGIAQTLKKYMKIGN